MLPLLHATVTSAGKDMGLPTRGWVALLVGVAVLAGAVALGTGRWHDVAELSTRLTTHLVPPQKGKLKALRKRERDALRALAGELDARIVWSSNRSGNHDLYMLDLADLQAIQLTDHPHVDFGSRFSPDGRSIVFMRSQREWVSFREKDPWDLFVLDLDSGEERRLTDGYHPTWADDGAGIVFHHGRDIYRHDLATGEEKLLLNVDQWFGGHMYWDPELHRDGETLALAITGVGAITTTVGSDVFAHLTQGQACQTTWVPGTRELLWMDPNGNGGTRIMRGSADASSAEVFMDLPGPFSHEYFPALSDDAGWMVWGASAGGHEHDRADYEIFAWQVGQPWQTAVRLTHYSGNDQWPDIHVATTPMPSDEER